MSERGNEYQDAQSAGKELQENRRQAPTVVDKFVIRLPQGLRDQIRELSEHNRRSMNSEIIMVLEQYIQQHATIEDEGEEGVQPPEDEHELAGRELPGHEQDLDEKLRSLPPEKKAALLSLLT